MKDKTETICIRLPKQWIQYLKNVSRKLSYDEKKDTHYHELIRKAIKNKYRNIENE